MSEQIKYELLKTELLLTQQQVDKYDQLSSTTKAWAITLWAASVGWSFQVKRKEVLLLSVLILLTFWFFDSLNKTFRQDYKKRRDEIAAILNKYSTTKKFPPGTSSPRLPSHRRIEAIRNAFELHLILPYLLLAFVALVLYFKF